MSYFLPFTMASKHFIMLEEQAASVCTCHFYSPDGTTTRRLAQSNPVWFNGRMCSSLPNCMLPSLSVFTAQCALNSAIYVKAKCPCVWPSVCPIVHRRMTSTPATMSRQRSTSSKQHLTLLPKTATMSNEFIVKFKYSQYLNTI